MSRVVTLKLILEDKEKRTFKKYSDFYCSVYNEFIEMQEKRTHNKSEFRRIIEFIKGSLGALDCDIKNLYPYCEEFKSPKELVTYYEKQCAKKYKDLSYFEESLLIAAAEEAYNDYTSFLANFFGSSNPDHLFCPLKSPNKSVMFASSKPTSFSKGSRIKLYKSSGWLQAEIQRSLDTDLMIKEVRFFYKKPYWFMSGVVSDLTMGENKMIIDFDRNKSMSVVCGSLKESFEHISEAVPKYVSDLSKHEKLSNDIRNSINASKQKTGTVVLSSTLKRKKEKQLVLKSRLIAQKTHYMYSIIKKLKLLTPRSITINNNCFDDSQHYVRDFIKNIKRNFNEINITVDNTYYRPII